MSSYRFCRSDDVPLLVRAYNRCYRVHFPELPEMTVDEFRRLIRELNLWTSSCMVAFRGDEPIAVLLAAKRDTENLIYRIGVHPDHQRQEHGRHLLTSLSSKLAILGPPRLLAEVPAKWDAACALFESCGYRRERTYVDYEWKPAHPLSERTELVVPIAVDELLEAGAFDNEAQRCWERAPQTLLNRKDRIRGIAIASDRIEAYLLYREAGAGEPREIVALDSTESGNRETLLGLLVRHHVATADTVVRIPRVWSEEIPSSWLEQWGFRPASEYAGYAASATTA